MDALEKAQKLAKKGLAGVRESVDALRISPVENRRLDEAIAELVDEAQTSGFPTVFHLVGKSLPIDSKSALALYRVAQEGLTNISKHAQATHTEVTLDFSHRPPLYALHSLMMVWVRQKQEADLAWSEFKNVSNCWEANSMWIPRLAEDFDLKLLSQLERTYEFDNDFHFIHLANGTNQFK